MLNDNTIVLKDKVKKFSSYCEIETPELSMNEWSDLFLSLERLDDYWSVLLNQLRETDISDIETPDIFEKYFENLIKYFTYRHITIANDSEMLFFICSVTVVPAALDVSS